MIRVVLDTNVVISALLNPSGLQDRVFKLGLHGHVQLYISRDVIAEYERVMRYPRLKIGRPQIRSALTHIKNAASVVQPTRKLTECPDEDDNRILECADAAGADLLVTGNKRHFPRQWRQTIVVNAREFLEWVYPAFTK